MKRFAANIKPRLHVYMNEWREGLVWRPTSNDVGKMADAARTCMFFAPPSFDSDLMPLKPNVI